MEVWCKIFYGLEICGDEYTYEPSEDSILIYSRLIELIPHASIVYDVGSGSGVIALGLARHGIYVVGVDILYNVALNSFHNSFRNELDGYVDFINGDALESLRNDLSDLIIVSNPPYLPGAVETEEDYMYIGGEYGIELIKRIIEFLLNSSSKYLYTVVSSYTKFEILINSYSEYLIFRIVDSLALDGESLYLYEITKKS